VLRVKLNNKKQRNGYQDIIFNDSERTGFKGEFMRKILLFYLGILYFCISVAQAGTMPWKWQFAMTGEESGQPLSGLTALMIDGERERYYIVDSGSGRLLSYDRDGKLINVLKAGGQLSLPFDLVRTSDGLYWVVELKNNTLTSINLKDRTVNPHELLKGKERIFPDRLEQQGDFFYVVDKRDGSLFQINREFEVIQHFRRPDGMASFVDFTMTQNGLWALDQQGKRVVHFSMKGEVQTIFPVAETDFPASIAIGPAGLVYVLDRHQGNIAVFHPSGTFKYRFLEKGQARGQLYYPIEIRFDPWGRLCVVEEGNGRVEVFAR
jgi:streptogramin lyase